MAESKTRYWLTTHWPQLAGDKYVGHRHVYIQDGRQAAGKLLKPGDKILFYETQSGKNEVEELADGTRRIIPRQIGKVGIVTAAEVATPLFRRNPADSISRYSDNTVLNWAWEAKTRRHISEGFVSREEVNRVLGYQPGNVLRGFGDLNSGLKNITPEQYEELVKIFRTKSRRKAPAPGGQQPPPGHWREGGGEGPEHLALKNFIAADPAAVLQESGLSTFKVEYPFPSGDRADIVLRDDAGRFVAVEVELHQRDNQLEGILQAVKYRHMIAITEGVTFEECRSLLVAYSIAPAIKKLCRAYDVEVVEIPRGAK